MGLYGDVAASIYCLTADAIYYLDRLSSVSRSPSLKLDIVISLRPPAFCRGKALISCTWHISSIKTATAAPSGHRANIRSMKVYCLYKQVTNKMLKYSYNLLFIDLLVGLGPPLDVSSRSAEFVVYHQACPILIVYTFFIIKVN